MNYEEFKSYVCQEAEKEIKGKGSVLINSVTRNNGTELDGLVIITKESNISPTIYLNFYYSQYLEGKDIAIIITEIMDIYKKNKSKVNIQTEELMDYNKMSDRIVYKVINYERNYKLLKTVPHKRILDLAIVFYCIMEQRENSNATFLIHNTHIKDWGVLLEDIYETALRNTVEKLPVSIKKMRDVIMELMSKQSDEIKENSLIEDNIEMYVITNIYKSNGAACIFYDNILKDFADSLDSDIYILPSSIHEAILVPTSSGIEKGQLEKMVREVNEEVAIEEVLSDKVYIYNRDNETITL